jgi:hypothetical protein
MADYNYIVKSIFNAKPKYNVSFDRANGTVNIGGVGYRGGSLSRAFKSSGSSSDILNNFFKANKNPQKTKREVEKISKGKIKVKIGKGYGNEPIVYYSLKESINERYRPNLESKGWEVAQKVIRQLQSSVFRKLDDDELLEFRKAIADAFNLDGVLKETTINERKVTKTFHFKGKTYTDMDEIDADFSRKGIKSKPDFNNRKVTVTGDERKIDKIAKFYRGIEENTINERKGGMDVIRRIVKNHQFEKGVDVQTANYILNVYNKVDSDTKKIMDKVTLNQLTNIILKSRK